MTTGSNLTLRRFFDVAKGLGAKDLKVQLNVKSKNYSKFYNDLQRIDHGRLIKRTFSSWSQHTKKRIMENKMLSKLKDPKRFRNKCFYLWLNGASKRMQSYKLTIQGAKKLHVIQKKYYLRLLKDFNAKLMMIESHLEDFRAKKLRILKLKSFGAFKFYLQQKRLNTQKNDNAIGHYVHKLANKILVALKLNRAQRTNRRLIQEDSHTFWSYKTTKRSAIINGSKLIRQQLYRILKAWREYSTKKSTLQQKVQVIVQQKKDSYGQQLLQNLKHLIYSKEYKNVLIPRAIE